MPYIYDYGVTSEDSDNTSITFTLPSPDAGDLLVAVATKDTTTGSAFTFGGTGWGEIDLGAQSQSDIAGRAYYAVVDGSTADLTVTSTDPDAWVLSWFRIKGHDAANPIDASAGYKSTVNAMAFPAITTSSDGCLILNTVSADGNRSIYPKTPNSINNYESSGISNISFFDYQDTAGAVSVSHDISCISNDNTHMTSIAIKPDGGVMAEQSRATQVNTYWMGLWGSSLGIKTPFAFTDANAAAFPVTTVMGGTIKDALLAGSNDNGIFPYATASRPQHNTTSFVWGDAVGNGLSFPSQDLTGKSFYIHWKTFSRELPELYEIPDGGMFAVLRSGAGYATYSLGGSNTKPHSGNSVATILNMDTATPIESSGFDKTAVDGIFYGLRARRTGSTTSYWSNIGFIDTATFIGGKNNPITFSKIADGIRNCWVDSQAVQGSGQVYLKQPVQIGEGGEVHFEQATTALEFAEIYNANGAAAMQVPENWQGIAFNTGANSTISINAGSISAPDRWHFKCEAGNLGTYDLSGLQVINATVTLGAAVTISGVTFNGCSQISPAGTDLSDGVTFTNTDKALLLSDQNDFDDIAGTVIRSCDVGIEIGGGTQSVTLDGVKFSGNAADFEYTGAGTLTVNLTNGANAATANTPGGGTVVFNNSQTLSLIGLNAGSEVRIYETGTATELAGVETSGTSFDYIYNYAGDVDVDIVILATGYKYYRTNGYTLSANGGTLPVSQIVDRVYDNPA